MNSDWARAAKAFYSKKHRYLQPFSADSTVSSTAFTDAAIQRCSQRAPIRAQRCCMLASDRTTDMMFHTFGRFAITVDCRRESTTEIQYRKIVRTYSLHLDIFANMYIGKYSLSFSLHNKATVG